MSRTIEPMAPEARRCPMCLGETKGEGIAICIDPNPCIRRTRRLDARIYTERTFARLNVIRARGGREPLPVRHWFQERTTAP